MLDPDIACRAQDVIDGFRRPTERLAYDVMLLLRRNIQQEDEIDRLKECIKKLRLAAELKKAAGSNPVDDLMGIFGIRK